MNYTKRPSATTITYWVETGTSPTHEQTPNDKEKRHRTKVFPALRRARIRSSIVCFQTLNHSGCRVCFVFLCSTRLNIGTFLMHPLAVLSHLRPRFAYILDHYGRARSRRRASARHGEDPLHQVLNIWCQYMTRGIFSEDTPRSLFRLIVQRYSSEKCSPGILDH